MRRLINRFYITLVIYFAGFCTPVIVFSQSPSQIAEMESEATHYLQEYKYHLALPLYLQLDSVIPNNPKYIFPIGVCYLNTSYEENKALVYFEKCLQAPEKYPPYLHYYIGKAYHLSHKMDKAIHHFETYNSSLKKNLKKNHATIEKVNREIEMCTNGKELMATPLNLDIINIGPEINSEYPDYAAILSADQNELIFTSCRPNTTGGLKDDLDGRFHEDIYVSFKSEKGWSDPKNLGDSVNTSGHDATIALSADGQTLFLFRQNPDPLSFSSGNIYTSDLIGKSWSNANPLPDNINSSSHELGASLSPDGRLLYFSSNRPGGYGGMDIYMVRRLPNGEWAIPMNLGSKINTPYNEDCPFIHSDGKTLYFSSMGHKTMGGYDIFKSEYAPEKLDWSKPQNVGYPISTAHDDIHFSWSPDGRKIYFSSIRDDSYGSQDIYYAVIHQEESTEILVMKGFIVDSLNNTPILGQITITDQNSKEVVGIFKSNASSGKYLIVLNEGHYKMKIESPNHEACEQELDIIELNGFEEVDKNIILCPKAQDN